LNSPGHSFPILTETLHRLPELTPSEAAELSSVVAAFTKAVEATDFERRLRALEEPPFDP